MAVARVRTCRRRRAERAREATRPALRFTVMTSRATFTTGGRLCFWRCSFILNILSWGPFLKSNFFDMCNWVIFRLSCLSLSAHFGTFVTSQSPSAQRCRQRAARALPSSSFEQRVNLEIDLSWPCRLPSPKARGSCFRRGWRGRWPLCFAYALSSSPAC